MSYLVQSATDDWETHDLRPVASLQVEFEELFGPTVRLENGVDGFAPWEAAGSCFEGETIGFLRYAGFPKGVVSFYARHALQQSAKHHLLTLVLVEVGLPHNRIIPG